jgi:hypothetical protein
MDVVVWLRSLGLERYEAAFRQNDIDETVLPNLTAADRGALSSLMPERRFRRRGTLKRRTPPASSSRTTTARRSPTCISSATPAGVRLPICSPATKPAESRQTSRNFPSYCGKQMVDCGIG